mgnify:CR=1 FL=1
MHNFITTLLLLALSLSANGESPKPEGTLLRLQLVKDSTYQMVYSTNEIMYASKKLERKRMENKVTAYTQFKVVEILENQNYQIEFKVNRIQSSQTSGTKIFSYDSREQGGSATFPEVLVRDYEKILQKPVSLEINPRGEVLTINPNNLEMSGISLKNLIQSIIHPFPKRAVSIGDNYQNSMRNPRLPKRDIILTYRISEINATAVELTIKAAIAEKETPEYQENFRFQNHGTLTLNPTTGWMRRYEGQSTLKGKSPTSGSYFLITNYSHYSGARGK